MVKLRSIGLMLLILLASFGVMHAQNTDSCGLLADTILESAQDTCGDVGTNEVCYAKSPINLTLPDGVSADFESGDRMDLSAVGSLSTVDAGSILHQHPP